MRSALVALGALLVFAFAAAPASAHAAVVSSSPEAGAILGSPPGVVRISFSEPLNVKLSRAEVIDPSGRSVSGAATGPGEIGVPLATSLPGIYEVRWSSVSTIDGHTLHGSFRFGVGVDPGEAESSLGGLGPGEVAVATFRIIEYLGLLTSIGMLLLGRLAARNPRLPWVRFRLSAVLWASFAAGVFVVVGEAALASWPPNLGAFLLTGLPGIARLVRLGALLAAALVANRRRGLVAPLVAVALFSMAAAGHAAASTLGVLVDAVHLGAAGLWAGGILALSTLRPSGGWRGEGRVLLDRFTPVAIGAFAITVATGSVRGFQELGSLGDLVGSSYGLILLAKIVAVAIMVQLSILAWRRLSAGVRIEAIVAIVVVIAAGLLAAFPLPPGRLAEAEDAGSHEEGVSALPVGGELTMGAHAGQVLVGFSISPARPGENRLLLFVRSLNGDEADAKLPVGVSVDGDQIPITQCGPTCREGSTLLRGGERVEISIETPTGGTARLVVPPLPVRDGSALLQRSIETTHELRSFRAEETLTSGLATVRTRYWFQAPDAMRVQIPGGATSVLIGETRFLQQRPGGPWTKSSIPATRVPTLLWDAFAPYLDVRVAGFERIGGARTTIVSFYGSAGEDVPAWFRLWIRADGLVVRSEMLADGHFMTDEYFGFDDPVMITRPT
ncbi:MAG: copper resistance protein CopC [Actinomycetota bacterium]